MTCFEARHLMSGYLDSVIGRSKMTRLDRHFSSCSRCAARFAALRQTQAMAASLGRKAAPTDLALRLRLALSQEIADARRSRWEMLHVHWENAFRAVMVPATGGLVAAVVMFGLLINFLVPMQFAGANDVPTVLYTPPELQSTPFAVAMNNSHTDPLIVEAYVGPDGRIQDYRILSGSADESGLSQLKNMLIFATFRPATSFGRPTAGRAILAFSDFQVRG